MEEGEKGREGKNERGRKEYGRVGKVEKRKGKKRVGRQIKLAKGKGTNMLEGKKSRKNKRRT